MLLLHCKQNFWGVLSESAGILDRIPLFVSDLLTHQASLQLQTVVVDYRWLSVRLEMLGICIVFGAALFVSVLLPRNAGLAGLALTSALNLTGQQFLACAVHLRTLQCGHLCGHCLTMLCTCASAVRI